jgi:hypothetical protein
MTTSCDSSSPKKGKVKARKPTTLGGAQQYDPEDITSSGLTQVCVQSKMLLGTPTNMASVAGFEAFKAAAKSLASSYASVPPKQTPAPATTSPAPSDIDIRPFSSYFDSAGAGAVLSGASSLLTAAKAQTTVSSSTFSPTDQAFYNDLESAMKHVATIDLVATAYPRQLDKASVCVIQPLMDQIYANRKQAIGYLAARRPDDPISGLKEQDAELTVLQNLLTNSGTAAIAGSPYGPGSLLLGAAILRSLGEPDVSDSTDCHNKTIPKYSVLVVTDDVAGGGSRTNLYFLLNLLLPGPHPSYNGGAIVSYSVRDQDGGFQDAGTLRFIYGYTKWKQPPLRKRSDPGFANFPAAGKGNQWGHWAWIY